MLKIKNKDEVVVLTGRDKGKRGVVQKVCKDGRLIVSGVNRVKCHVKANPQKGIAGGIVEKDGFIHQSNVALFNPETGKADRVGFRFAGEEAGNVKERYFKSTKKTVGE